MQNKLPVVCPSCEKRMYVSRVVCEACGTEVSGHFTLPAFLELAKDEQDFILSFFLASGSIKEMARQAGNSYPTMRNKMDDLIEKINAIKKENSK